MNKSLAEHAESHGSRFCALGYRAQSRGHSLAEDPSVIVIALRDEDGKIELFVHPDLHTIVEEEDWSYLDSLLRDFLERAKLSPDALFSQLCNLNVGPLLTAEVGAKVSNYPLLSKRISHFVLFKS